MEQEKQTSGISKLQVFGIVIGAMLITMAATLYLVKIWIFPQPFQPVVLNPGEEKRLESKLAQFDRFEPHQQSKPVRNQENNAPPGEVLQPEAYSEAGASREIKLSEREINAMVAKNTDLASKVAIDLADDLVSLKMLIPVDPDFPFLGGKTLKVRAGAELAFRAGRPVFIIRGISVMGVPLPSAWMGGLKNFDLVQVFGSEPGFWKGFADGVASIQVKEGNLQITLKE
jgi:hypothetical protein